MFKIFRFFYFIIFTGFISLSYADHYSLDEAIRQYNILNLELPAANQDGRIQTLNKTGAMSPEIDEATKQFIEFAKGKKVLEIGGAYGKAMIEALKKYPDIIYHFSDFDKRHLFIAAEQVQNAKLDPLALKNLKFITKDITKALDPAEEQYDSILIARVLHFLSPTQLNSAINNIYNLLKPGGQVYVVAITPYLKAYKKFIPIYEKRIADKEEFPGYVINLKEWTDKNLITPAQFASIIDEPFMFLDCNVLSKLFKQKSFEINQCDLQGLPYHSDSWSLDGRENVILIARKKDAVE